MNHKQGVVLVVVLICGGALGRSWRQLAGSNFVGEGTNDLALSIMQNNVEENKNYVFSALGYSAILAILAEGARGATRNQLVAALRLPEDTYAVRTTYKKLLANMQERGVENKPEFKNWFYVYKNYSVEESYKEILLENYLTEVRNIGLDWDEYEDEDLMQVEKKKKEVEPAKKKEDKSSEETDSSEEHNSSQEGSSEEANNKKSSPADPLEAQGGENAGKQEEGLVEGEKQEEEGGKEITESEKEEEQETKDEKIKKKEADEKTEMLEEDNKEAEGGRSSKNKDILTALSANRLCTVVKSEREKNPKSRMIVFNGLYFRGNWSLPFTTTEESTFYTTSTEKKSVAMMESLAEYSTGDIADLDATALEIPYQGKRYSLMILLPNLRDGLAKLTSDLSGYSLRNIDSQMTNKEVQIYLPKFKFYTISHPKAALMKSGVTDIFDDSADLSGITGHKGLYLDDLVQLVTIEVDQGNSKANFITSTRVTTRNNPIKMSVDRPFLFFLRDKIDNLVVVSGKVVDPSIVN